MLHTRVALIISGALGDILGANIANVVGVFIPRSLTTNYSGIININIFTAAFASGWASLLHWACVHIPERLC